MKITCQSCQAKYNVADEKVQGKIVKIRCRKCGATIVVNGTGGASANGSHQADATAQAGAAGTAAQWHVNIADNDQRTMSLAELVDAYNAGVVTQDTFIWTDGMDDWKPLAEVDAVVSALHASANQVAPAANLSLPTPGAFEPNAVAGYEQAAQAAAYGAGPAAAAAYEPQAPAHGGAADAGLSAATAAAAGWSPAAAPSAPAPEAKRAAVVKREARGRDLFATHASDDVQTSAPSMAGGAPPAAGEGKLTGQRNENSVLFSLAVLTKSAEQRAPSEQTTAGKEDSGLIDLKALAAKAESMRPAPLADADVFHAPLGMAPPPLGAPIGAVGPVGSDAQPKSKLPLIIGGSAAMLVLLVVGVLIGVKLAGGSSAVPAASAAASSPPIATASAPPPPAATESAAATAEASASAAPTPSVATTAPKKHWGGGGGGYHPSGGGHASAGGSSGGGASPSPASAPKKGGGDCGCNGDLMCLMKCSTH
jgi:predicted Zn finger-like uncharacterized protein